MTTFRRICIGFAIAVAFGVAGCEEETFSQPGSLQAPMGIEAVDGTVCLPDVVFEDATIPVDPLPRCEQGGNGFGLVPNHRSDRLGVVALGQRPGRMVNIDARRPGITHIRTGEGPVDVATTGDGTAAVVANQTDGTLTGIDLWTLRPLRDEIELEGTLERIEALQSVDGQWATVTLTSEPNRLELNEAVVCDEPDTTDRRDYEPADTCEWIDPGPRRMELPGRPVDMSVDADNGRAWVIYRDVDALSWVALDDRGLGDEECTQANAQPPCEIDRTAWDSSAENWGATRVDADPAGMFVYVLDRADSRLLVFDRQRRELIDVSESMEPPLAPLEDRTGISLIRGSSAMSAEVWREVIGDGHVWYRFGARIAARDGRLYEVATVDVECRFEGSALESTEDFLFDDEVRENSEEAVCLRVPEFPLGGNPDFQTDDELLDQRVVDTDDARFALTPVFGLVDGTVQQSRLVGRSQCQHPESLRDAIADAADDEVTGCGSPLVPQPVAAGVDDDLDNYADASRADLMEFARVQFDGEQPEVLRSVFDLRTAGEQWSVTYEGALPSLGRDGRGLVDPDESGIFSSGGTDLCSAGVSRGDRLVILTEPREDADCEEFQGEPRRRTWEIAGRTAFEMELEVLDDEETAGELPTRECFDRGLRYEVRPDDEWTVVGEQSGMTSRYRTSGEQCIAKDGTDDPRSRIQGRVETGEQYVGPYLSFRLREGTLEPVQGTEYTFRVERNFSVASEQHVPEDRSTTIPSEVRFLPDLGTGRLISVVDSGGNRIYVSDPDAPGSRRGFIR